MVREGVIASSIDGATLQSIYSPFLPNPHLEHGRDHEADLVGAQRALADRLQVVEEVHAVEGVEVAHGEVDDVFLDDDVLGAQARPRAAVGVDDVGRRGRPPPAPLQVLLICFCVRRR